MFSTEHETLPFATTADSQIRLRVRVAVQHPEARLGRRGQPGTWQLLIMVPSAQRAHGRRHLQWDTEHIVPARMLEFGKNQMQTTARLLRRSFSNVNHADISVCGLRADVAVRIYDDRALWEAEAAKDVVFGRDHEHRRRHLLDVRERRRVRSPASATGSTTATSRILPRTSVASSTEQDPVSSRMLGLNARPRITTGRPVRLTSSTAKSARFGLRLTRLHDRVAEVELEVSSRASQDMAMLSRGWQPPPSPRPAVMYA